jgi:ABC-type multidrug transport system fused ATPase/permease subunit
MGKKQQRVKSKLSLLVPGTLIRALKVLSKNQQQKIFTVVLIQSSLSLLDLAGVAAVGLVGALAVTGVQSKAPGNRVGQVLEILNLQSTSLQKQVAILGLIAAALFVLRTVLSVFLSRKILFFLSRCSASISGDLIEKLLSQPLSMVQNKPNQERLYSLTSGVNALIVDLIGNATVIFSDFILLIILCTGLFIVDPALAIATIVFLLVVALILYSSMTKRAFSLGTINSELTVLGNEKILEVLNSYREALVKNRRMYYSNQIRVSRINLANVTAEFSFMPNISKYVIEASLIVGAVLISATQFLLEDASRAVATLGIFIAAGSRIAPAILRIQSSAIQVRVSGGRAKSSLDLVDSLSDARIENHSINDFKSEHIDFVPKVEINNLNFTYENSSIKAIDSVSLKIQSGEFIAIAGASGAGKTTLVDCIIGAFRTNPQSVLISGLNPVDAIEKWPGAIGYVPQDVVILNGTVRENVIFGYSESQVPENLVDEALQKAHLFDHVSGLREGINSFVGDKGSSLSGGQRQRLGIARALVSKPRLLILDEATSSLDGKSEADISDSINEFRGEVTTIIIAHRLSTVRTADKVIYMNKGRIEFIGTFDEVRRNVPEFDNQAKLMGL